MSFDDDEYNEHENDVDQNTSKNHADRISWHR